MIEIRPLHENEIEQAKTAMPADAAEPDWKNCFAVLDDGELAYFFGIQTRTVVEPMYKVGKANHSRVGYGAMTWIDGFLRGHVLSVGRACYEFFVGDDHPEFQRFIENNLPVSKGREKAGLYFFRKFEV